MPTLLERLLNAKLAHLRSAFATQEVSSEIGTCDKGLKAQSTPNKHAINIALEGTARVLPTLLNKLLR